MQKYYGNGEKCRFFKSVKQLEWIKKLVEDAYRLTKAYPWAQLGGGHGGRVPPTFSDSGDIICHTPRIFLFRFRNILVSHQAAPPHIL